MKYHLVTVLLFVSVISIAQSTGKPENITGSVTSAKPAFFSKHRALAANPLFIQLTKEPGNSEGWLQLYKSVSKSQLPAADRKQVLADMTLAASDFVSNSWQFSLIKFLQSGRRDSSAIHQALITGEANKQLYPYAIQWALIAKNTTLLKQYCKSLYQLEPLSATQYEYHYNALMSAEDNATVYAKGLTDLVPMLMLQEVLNIRKDIDLRFYEDNVKPPANAYLCLSLGKETIQKYSTAFYTGLLVKLSDERKGLLTENLETNFRWQQLDQSSALSDTDKQLYQNYLPAMLILYNQYKTTNRTKAISWKLRIDKLAAITGTTALVNKQTGL